MINRVYDEEQANYCDILLTALIQDEKKYNPNIAEKFVVKDYFKNVIQDKNNILLVAKENNQIVGYIFLKQVVSDDKTGYLIDGLYVLETYRNKGIAKKLINEAMNIISTSNISFIDINVMAKNTAALNLYKSFGFEEFKVQMRNTDIRYFMKK